MQLNFTKPRAETYGNRTEYVSYAVPNPEFWAKWRYNKSAMMESGINIMSFSDDAGRAMWRVVRVQRNLLEEVPVPATLPVRLKNKSKLFDYQVPAASALLGSLLSNRVGLDGSDTGTGKTYVALATVLEAGLQPAIVCTKTGIYDWKIVCKYFKVNPVFIFNWESTIGRIYKKDRKIKKLNQPPNPYIKMRVHPYSGKPEYVWRIAPGAKVCFIFDEAHKANGLDSHCAQVVRAALGYKVLALSATLADKSVNLRNVGSLTGLFEWDDFNGWLRKNGCFENDRGQMEPASEHEILGRVSRYIFPNFGVRVRKSEVPDFPDIQNIARLYDIDKKADFQNKAYAKLQVQIAKLKEQGKTAQVLVLQLRHRQMAEFCKVSLLAELAREHMESGMSVVLFCNFTETLKMLMIELKTKCAIFGGQDIGRRRDNIEDFQADRERVLVSNIQAGGTGLSLHDLRGNHPRIAIICPTYDAKQLIQVLGRIHRAGAKSKAINLLVYAARTIEEKVYSTVKQKIGNVNLLNDGDLADLETFKEE